VSSEAYGDPRTRQRILEATWDLIEERGARFRLLDVAERAGVSRQALYLHFDDRTGLLLALVAFLDESLQADKRAAHVFTAHSGPEMLERAVALYATLAPRIDRVAQVLDAAQSEDPAVRAAWRDRMDNRYAAHLSIVRHLADEGLLAEEWTIDEAAALFHATMLPGTWRELTGELGWTADEYRTALTLFLRRALIRGEPSG